MRKMKLNNQSEETKVVCPKCGAQFAIAEKTHVASGVVIGKDAGLGTIHPQVVGQDQPKSQLPTKAEDRIAALKAVGVDVSGYFSMKGADGGEYVGRLENGQMSLLDDSDPIFNLIQAEGDVYNSKLARRWVMSQMFHMLSRESNEKKWGYYKNSITEQIRGRGYDYMWKQMTDELHAQFKMKKNGDDVNYHDRNHWFDAKVLFWMISDYESQLKKHIKSLKVKHCKGVPYKHILGENVFVSDIEKKIFYPIRMTLAKVERSDDPKNLYEAILEFNRIRKSRSWNPKQNNQWIDAYKGAGAFFTMQNLIRYHKCTFIDDNNKRLSKNASYEYLLKKNDEYMCEGWRMIGLLRQFLKDNNIDINAKMEEWRKK